jgi:hypothetical protein
MKFLFALLFSPLISSGQLNIDSIALDEAGNVRSEKIIEAKGTADELMTKIKIWGAQFNGVKKFIQVEDNVQKILSGGGAAEYVYNRYRSKGKEIDTAKGYYSKGVGQIDFNIVFYFKDGKVKIVIDAITFNGGDLDNVYNDVKLNREFIKNVKTDLAGSTKQQIKGYETLSRLDFIFKQLSALYDMIKQELNKKSEKDF